MPKGTRSKTNRKSLASVAALAVASGKRSAQVDLKVEADNALKEGAAYLLPLDLIKPRPSQDIRPIDHDHVVSLMESIRILGLLQPIYVDKHYHFYFFPNYFLSKPTCCFWLLDTGFELF